MGVLLESPEAWHDMGPLTTDDFLISAHRKIWQAIAALNAEGQQADVPSVAHHLGDSVAVEYVSGLVDGVVRVNLSQYIRQVREAATKRRFLRLCEELSTTEDTAERLALLRTGQELLQTSDDDSWRCLFHSYDEILHCPPAQFAIEGFLQEEGITLIGGLAGHGKTLCMLAMVRALLEGGKLFHHFRVNQTAERVLYLIPEAGLGPFSSRLKTFRLEEHIRADRLFCRTLSANGQLLLNDPRLLEAAKGADIFLDTAIRFMSGDENNAAEQKVFADTLFSLQRAGARSITGAHHSPKSFGKDSFMTLENVLRGSGDIGAMLATCWGISQIDGNATRIFVQNVKARDFLPCEPFIIQGRPSIDETGFFELTHPPGFAGTLSDNKPQGGRPQNPDTEDKIRQAQEMHASGKSYKEIAEALEVPKSTVGFWLGKSKRVQ